MEEFERLPGFGASEPSPLTPPPGHFEDPDLASNAASADDSSFDEEVEDILNEVPHEQILDRVRLYVPSTKQRYKPPG